MEDRARLAEFPEHTELPANWSASHAGLRDSVLHLVSRRRVLEDELHDLETENISLRHQLDRTLKTKKQIIKNENEKAHAHANAHAHAHAHAYNTHLRPPSELVVVSLPSHSHTSAPHTNTSISEDAPPQTRQASHSVIAHNPHLTFLASVGFLSAANSVLRSNLFSLLSERRKNALDYRNITKQQRMSVEWVLNNDAAFKFHQARNPFVNLGLGSSELSSEWNHAFSHIQNQHKNHNANQKNNNSNNDNNNNKNNNNNNNNNNNDHNSNDLASSVLEVCETLQANRPLYSDCEAKFKYEAADDEVADAMDNYGFGSSGDSSPYEFDEEDSASNIVMDADHSGRVIKCATLNKLIERVTHEKYVDLNTRYVFLLTYHSFTTPRELLAKLGRRWNVPIPPNLTHEEVQLFKATKLDRIQIRVCSVLKNWLDEHYSDFADDEQLKEQLNNLIANMLETSASVLSTQLARALAALIRKRERMGTRRLIPPNNAPKPLIPAKLTLASFSMEDCVDLELARQLTIIDFEKFRNIQPRECLNQNWSKPKKDILAPNIIAMIEQFNKVSSWVQYQIVSCVDISRRVMFFKKFLLIAEACRSLNNFNALFAIYCGLTANPIHRLRRTKEQIGAKSTKLFNEFQELFRGDKNSRNFRRVLQTTLTPAIPHLGIFLSDLTFTEDGNPDTLRSMINFQKRAKLAERIRWIKQYQQEGYQLESVNVIQKYFELNLKVVDPDTLWKMSKEAEQKLSTDD